MLKLFDVEQKVVIEAAFHSLWNWCSLCHCRNSNLIFFIFLTAKVAFFVLQKSGRLLM